MVSFGPLSVRFGRRATFAMRHICAFIMTVVVCWVPSAVGSYGLLLCLLPLFGFFGLGIHAGYAVYFPELFPTHLRATGSGFCFNTGRILAAPVLFWLSAELKRAYELNHAITLLAGFFLLGLVFLCFLPETRNKELPE
jgi:MFS family permease